jgi:hypothetical protein
MHRHNRLTTKDTKVAKDPPPLSSPAVAGEDEGGGMLFVNFVVKKMK